MDKSNGEKSQRQPRWLRFRFRTLLLLVLFVNSLIVLYRYWSPWWREAVWRGHGEMVCSAEWSPDETRVVSSSKDGTARIWRVSDGATQRILKGHTSWVQVATYSPQGDRIVTGSSDCDGRIWDAETGECLYILKGHERIQQRTIFNAAYSADGNVVATAEVGGNIRLWNAGDGTSIKDLGDDDVDGLMQAIFSNDDAVIIARYAGRHERAWDIETGQRLYARSEYSGPLHCHYMAYSADGKRRLSRSGQEGRDIELLRLVRPEPWWGIIVVPWFWVSLIIFVVIVCDVGIRGLRRKH